jgi:hypothetical protein
VGRNTIPRGEVNQNVQRENVPHTCKNICPENHNNIKTKNKNKSKQKNDKK